MKRDVAANFNFNNKYETGKAKSFEVMRVIELTLSSQRYYVSYCVAHNYNLYINIHLHAIFLLAHKHSIHARTYTHTHTHTHLRTQTHSYTHKHINSVTFMNTNAIV